MNNTPAKKSSGFADTVPSIKSKEAAAMMNIAAVFSALAPSPSAKISVILLASQACEF
jgi:hypothetical protein